MTYDSVVVDTNLIFSALIPNASAIRNTLLERNIIFYCPNFVITELFEHKEKLLKQTKLTDPDFYLYFNGVIEKVRFIPIDFISKTSREKAYHLCHDVDVKDTPFIALTIELNISIWTGDKILRNGLTKKGFTAFFNP